MPSMNSRIVALTFGMESGLAIEDYAHLFLVKITHSNFNILWEIREVGRKIWDK